MEPVARPRNPLFSLASIIIVCALIVVLGAVALTTWPTADDYCSRVLVTERGLDGAMRWLFFEWSGRVLTSTILYSTFGLVDIPTLRWVSLANCLLFAIAAYQIAKLVSLDDGDLRWPLCALVLAALSVGLYQLLGQTVFWATGGIVYMLPLVLASLWLVSIRRLLHGAKPRGGNLYGFVLGLLVGNSIELVIPIVAAYAALIVPNRWASVSTEARQALAVRLAGLGVGAVMLMVAPGNYNRARFTGSFRPDPAYLAGEYARMVEEIVTRAWPIAAMIGALATVAAIAVAVQWRSAPAARGPSPWRESIAFVLGAFASIVPVLAAPVQFAPRNGLYLLVFVLVAALIPTVAVLQGVRRGTWVVAGTVGLAAVATIYAAAPLVEDAQASAEFRDRQVARDRSLRQLPDSGKVDAIVEPFGLTVPRTSHFIEVDADRTQWNNICTAQYYGLHSIALAPKPK